MARRNRQINRHQGMWSNQLKKRYHRYRKTGKARLLRGKLTVNADDINPYDLPITPRDPDTYYRNPGRYYCDNWCYCDPWEYVEYKTWQRLCNRALFGTLGDLVTEEQISVLQKIESADSSSGTGISFHQLSDQQFTDALLAHFHFDVGYIEPKLEQVNNTVFSEDELATLRRVCSSRHDKTFYGVTMIMFLKPFWMKPLSGWARSKKDPSEILVSLANHLFVRYPHAHVYVQLLVWW